MSTLCPAQGHVPSNSTVSRQIPVDRLNRLGRLPREWLCRTERPQGTPSRAAKPWPFGRAQETAAILVSRHDPSTDGYSLGGSGAPAPCHALIFKRRQTQHKLSELAVAPGWEQIRQGNDVTGLDLNTCSVTASTTGPTITLASTDSEFLTLAISGTVRTSTQYRVFRAPSWAGAKNPPPAGSPGLPPRPTSCPPAAPVGQLKPQLAGAAHSGA